MQSCGNQAPKPAHTDDEMIAAAKAVDVKFIEGMNKEDVGLVMSCYWNSPDLIVYPPDESELKGYEASKESFTKFFAGTSGAKHEIVESNYKVAGDMVIGWGRVKMSVNGPDSTSPRIELNGRYTEVLAYKDSQLVYVVDHASVALPPPPAGAAPPMAEEKEKAKK